MKKNSKGTIALLIIGCVFLLIGLGCCGIFTSTLVEYFMTVDTQSAAALGPALGLILFLAPAAIAALIALILNIVAYVKAVKPRHVLIVIPFILSIVLPLLCLAEFLIVVLVIGN